MTEVENHTRQDQSSVQTHRPHEEYTSRLNQHLELSETLTRKFRSIGIVRIIFLTLGGIVLLRALSNHPTFAWWLVPVAIISLALLLVHHRIFGEKQHALNAAAFYQRGLARLTGRWAGTGITGEQFRDGAHPYAEDIDLFGRGSLFELLCTARTRAGEETLASWLRAPAAVEEVRARQAVIEELRLNLDLREDLALLGEEVRSGLHPEALAAWGSAPPVLVSRLLRAITMLLAALTVVSLGLWFAGYGLLPFWIMLLGESLFAFSLRGKVNQITGAVGMPGRDLALLSHILERLEREQFTSPRLVELRRALETDGQPPSNQIAGLHRLITWLDARLNQFFLPFAWVLLWDTQFSFAIEAWRQRSGALVAKWIAAVGEVEALGALAGYAYEHPRDPFPELLEAGVCFDGEALGHPLIAEDRCVRTDLRLDETLRLLVVSGSNMSGKSTLLRTVGVNTVLALAGAPVRAHRLRISPLALGASIHIQDNLQAGASLFYAEITRLRQLMDIAKGEPPLLFIIDEILHGTNSHDRRIGAEAILKGLVERGAVGLVTTHDLALTNVVDELSPRAANVHFEDHLEDGRMKFDYILRPGVVRKSNAIELMRSVGLEV
ncbi:MAG TPA: DNA mismatch repair protein MutS [Blastocatellia bacterium]|nr:DNA mismatch repair protein MutS [Blastocatellia bacterium]